jgi:hypothetical protein
METRSGKGRGGVRVFEGVNGGEREREKIEVIRVSYRKCQRERKDRGN